MVLPLGQTPEMILMEGQESRPVTGATGVGKQWCTGSNWREAGRYVKLEKEDG